MKLLAKMFLRLMNSSRIIAGNLLIFHFFFFENSQTSIARMDDIPENA
jgi:hypothetical protein